MPHREIRQQARPQLRLHIGQVRTAVRTSWSLCSGVNIWFRFSALGLTQTQTRSKQAAARRMISKCPRVMGSKEPEQIAVLMGVSSFSRSPPRRISVRAILP